MEVMQVGKQSTTRNRGIQFKDQEQRNRYNSLISRTISTCRYPDVNVMDRLGIDEHVIRLLNSQPCAYVPSKGYGLYHLG